MITSSVKGSYEFSSMNVLLFYGSNKLFIKAVFRGGSAPPPQKKKILIFLKNEGKEVEKNEKGWVGG